MSLTKLVHILHTALNILPSQQADSTADSIHMSYTCTFNKTAMHLLRNDMSSLE